MRQWMMGLGNADLRVRPSILFASIHKSGHASQIGLECQQLQVVEKPDVMLEVVGNSDGALDVSNVSPVSGYKVLFLGLLDAPFHVAERLEIVAHSPVVAGTKVSLQSLHAVRDRIQN